MQATTSDYAEELINTEHLSSFSVVEYFCESCGDLTPHHIEESSQQASLCSANATIIPPVSLHECVVCREEQESMIDEFDS